MEIIKSDIGSTAVDKIICLYPNNEFHLKQELKIAFDRVDYSTIKMDKKNKTRNVTTQTCKHQERNNNEKDKIIVPKPYKIVKKPVIINAQILKNKVKILSNTDKKIQELFNKIEASFNK